MSKNSASFFKSLVSVSIPVVLQELLRNSLSFTDTLMIGRLGEVSIAAVGLGNQIYFFIFVVVFGIASGCSIFASQFWGSNNKEGVQKTLGLCLTASVIISGLFAVITSVFPKTVLHLFTSEQNVVSTGCIYLKIVGISYVFVAVSESFSIILRATGDTKQPMFVTFFSMLMNIAGNYILIFVFRMGVKGAAVATVVSRFFEAVALAYISFSKSSVNLKSELIFKIKKGFVLRVFKTAFPVIIDDGLWVLGLTVYKVFFARMGVEVLASTNITESIQNLFFTLQNGLGAGASILIGQQIGRRQYDQAQKEACTSAKISLYLGLVSAILMLASDTILPSLFNVTEQVSIMVRNSIIVLSFTLPIKFFNHVFICGIGRSGGDTRFIFLMEVITVWLIGVPASIVSSHILMLAVWWVYCAIFLEDLTKFIIFTKRLQSRRWLNDLVNN